jgi:hypothetical protein
LSYNGIGFIAKPEHLKSLCINHLGPDRELLFSLRR